MANSLASLAKRERSRQSVKSRASAPPSISDSCAVFGCFNPTQRAKGQGLSETYCKRHIEMLRRHGSTWRRSFSAAELKPYRRAAERWIKAHREEARIQVTTRHLENFLSERRFLLGSSGEAVTPAVVRGLPPKSKADAALVRFQEAGKGGEDLLLIALSVEALYQTDGPRDMEFLHVQIAKVVHRGSSSGHYPVSSLGKPMKPSWPRSEGKMLRILGKRVREEARVFDLEDALEVVVKEAAG